ncbi:MAG TPA: hypothetical protein VJA40_03800 [archaeon]|nr:hypothetical protein [archaeon]
MNEKPEPRRLKREAFLEKTAFELRGFTGACSIIARLAGKEKDAMKARLEDDTGSVGVGFKDLKEFDSLAEGKTYRVLGRSRKTGKGEETVIEAEFVQDFSALDENMFKRVKALELGKGKQS